MRLQFGLVLLAMACAASAQDLVVYDDALRNDFVSGYSYGDSLPDFANAAPTRNGSAASIAFPGNNSNAVAFPNETRDFTAAQYAGIRFYVHGGASGGQQLRLQIYNNLGGAPAANVELDSYIAGGAIAANEWRLVEARFATLPLAFAGSFDRFDLQSDAAGVQPTLFIDDVALIAASPRIFADSFEGDAPGPAGQLRFVNLAGNLVQTSAESVGAVTYQVERVNGSNGAATVDLQIAAGGTASAPGDYSLTTATATWADGASGIRNVTLTIVDDPTDEPDETANLQLGNATGGASIVAPNAATLTIIDNDPAPAAPSFSINDVTVVEGNAGLTPFAFTVTRSGELSGTDTVQVQTADQSATGGSDYVVLPLTTLTFTPGVTIQAATANVNGDTTFEANETFFGNLSNPSSGTITDAQGLGTIQNDDAAPVPGQLRFSAATYSVAEDGGTASVGVQRINGSAGAISVEFATSDGSAVAPGDYMATAVSLNWADGESGTKTAFVPVVADALPENDETVGLLLANPTNGATLATPQSATLTIVEPELLFVPQFTQGGTGSVKVFKRGAGGFTLINTAALPPNTNPNAIAFAPDGKLWVVDGGNPNRLLRYASQNVAALANPDVEVTVTPGGNATGDYFDLAFFGDFAYVSQGFGGVSRILKLPLASLNAGGSPVPILLSNASLATPTGLEFDSAGRLWTANYDGQTLVRMNTLNGTADRVGNSVFLNPRASMSNPEGLAFDAVGTLWVGNNGAPTLAGYSAAQLDAPGFNAIAPAQFIDIEPGVTAPGNGHTGFVGGVAFDRDGDLWANYERAFTVIEYVDPGTPGQTLTNANTDPGFGGLAFWPVPATVQRGMPGGAPAAQFRGTTLVSMEMPFTQFDAGLGPVPGSQYPVFDERLIDYFGAKGMSALRILVGWEALQSQLSGPIPAASSGNYKTYFDNYKRIVDYATNVRGMTVLITPWQYDDNVNGLGFGGVGGPTWRGGRVGTEVSIAAWSDFWTKLSTHFKDNPRVAYVLVTEPNNMSTTQWFQIAQAGITAIRNSGSTQRIHVPGNGYSGASNWVTDNPFYDTAAVKVSNANGWLNANGAGQPISDPLNNIAVEVHTYLDPDQGGVVDQITSVTAARTQLAVTVNWARAQGLKVYLGEIGMHAGTIVMNDNTKTAAHAWADFIAYADANSDVLEGFTWWAGGDPAWWADEGANDGGHYAISPLCGAFCPVPFSGDRGNMDMIENDF